MTHQLSCLVWLYRDFSYIDCIQPDYCGYMFIIDFYKKTTWLETMYLFLIIIHLTILLLLDSLYKDNDNSFFSKHS